MTNQDLVLNIAVNLGRLGKWSLEKRLDRVQQFLQNTQKYLSQINVNSLNPSFRKTYETFLERFDFLQKNPANNDVWADTAFTWANILTHRAKLA